MAKVNTSKFMGMGQSGLEKKVDANSQKITLLKNIIKIQQSNLAEQLKSLSSDEGGGFSSGLDESIKSITNSVTSISETLKNTHQFEKDKAADEKQDKEASDRNKAEKDSEKTKFSGLKETAKKVLAPVQNMFAKAFEWLKKLFFAKVAIKLWDWLSNPENQDKVKSIVRFFKDWWPLMLAGYIAFATPFIPFTVMMIGAVKTLAIGIGAAVLKMKAAAIAMGPWGVAALALLIGGTAVAIHLAGKKSKTSQNVDQSVNEKGADATVNALQKEQEDKNKKGNWFTNFFRGTVMGENAEYERQQHRAKEGENPSYGFGGKIQNKNKGGIIPGRGPNKDTVPAMLTPGEFVMSRDAVDKWGADVLAGMNAAAGGTNKPTLMSGYNQGGHVDGMGFGPTMFPGGLGGGGGGTNALTEQAKVRTFGSTMGEVNRNWGFIGAEGTDYRTKKDYEHVYSVKDKIDDALNALDFMADKPEAIAGLERIGSSGPQFSPVGGVDRKLGVEPPPRRTSATVAYAQAQAKAQASGTSLGSNGSGPGGNDIPSFPVGTKVSSDKIKVLGITR